MESSGKILSNIWIDALANGDTFMHPKTGEPYIRISVNYNDIDKITRALREAENNPKVGVKIDKGITW